MPRGRRNAHAVALGDQVVPVGGAVAAPRASRYLRYAAGGVTGDMEFFTQRTRAMGATCSHDAELLALDLPQYQRMLREAPQLCAVLQHVILRNEMHSTARQLEMTQRLR